MPHEGHPRGPDQTTPQPAAPAADLGLVADLVTANHILFDQGVLDAFGHVSARHPEHPDRFLLARNMAPALVQAEDILEFDLDGTPLDARPPHLPRALHPRPDLQGPARRQGRLAQPLALGRAETVRLIETQVPRAWNFWKVKAEATAAAYAQQHRALLGV